MAEVDFSNARIEVDTSISRINPTGMSYVNLDTTVLYDVNYNDIVTNKSRTKLINESKQFLILYQGTFTASGTEFYIASNTNPFARWKISNISFNSGDTYVFQINADLVCN